MNTISMRLSDTNFAPIEFKALNLNHGIAMPMIMHPGRSNVSPAGSIFHDLTIGKYVDLFSPELNFFCSKGQPIKEILVSYNFTNEKLDGENEECCYENLLKDCMVTSISVSGKGSCPIETLTFCFNSIHWKFIAPENKITSAEWIIKKL